MDPPSMKELRKKPKRHDRANKSPGRQGASGIANEKLPL